ncbi:hypothetical protein ACFQ3K_17095 [Brucella gallinifaecis]|uniref:Uncharacterized protein n=1 Tax=Brucella gallinifaecis TaxID=215590 RepID=A0A502BKG8_9HYPH|nr:hypothetical protein [Brucella gallinifaecis]TPF73968.1 hypothetical protein FHY56_17000 [Brucella gallinifaecis]
MAQFLGTRIPVLLGNLVSMGLGAMAGHEVTPLEAKSLPPLPEPDLCGTLCDLILHSRFPGDTGAARYRQAAFISFVFAGNRRGEKVTATDLAKIVDSHYSQMEVLGKTMEQRGMIKREHAVGVGQGKSAKLLFIREDAVEAFDAAHKAAVGISLL